MALSVFIEYKRFSSSVYGLFVSCAMIVLRRLAENVCVGAVEYFDVWLGRSVHCNKMINS